MQYITAFVGLFLWRYLRLVINIVASWTFKSTSLPIIPTYSNTDVTVVISTLADSVGLRRCLLSISACHPAAMIVVTPGSRIGHVRKICEELDLPHVQILNASKANKRLQMIQGLKEVHTSFTFFADDDVFWVPTFLTYNLAPFEDCNVGAVGGLQTLERKPNANFWDFLGAIYLQRRTFEISATIHMDGGLGCLSGRTFGIRTSIIQNESFVEGFTDEKWLGVVPLVAADDDNFLTRYLVNHGWKIAFQCVKEAELSTTLENNAKFLSQCVRWRRTTWRSNFTSLFVDRVIWHDQPFSTYALHLSSFNLPALIMDPLLGYLLYCAVDASAPGSYLPTMSTTFMLFFLWLAFTKTVKFVGYFHQYPSDLKFLPVLYAFGYLHGFIHFYTLLTLYKTNWGGGRTGITQACKALTFDSFPPSDLEHGTQDAIDCNMLKRVGSSGTDIRFSEKKMMGLTSLKREASPASDGPSLREEKNLPANKIWEM